MVYTAGNKEQSLLDISDAVEGAVNYVETGKVYFSAACSSSSSQNCNSNGCRSIAIGIEKTLERIPEK